MDKYTFECDRCGKTTTGVCIPHMELTRECSKDYFTSILLSWELCPDCMREVLQFMHGTTVQVKAG